MELLNNGNTVLVIVGMILTVAALVGAISVIFNKIISPTYKWIKQTINSIDKIDYIYGELRENGGHSIKDSVRRIEERLVFNDERQRALMRDSTYGILEMNANGLVVWANRTFSIMTGRTLMDLRGNGWLGIIDELDRRRVTEEWQLAKEQMRETNLQLELVKADSTTVPVHLIIHVMEDAHSNNVGFIGLFEFPSREKYCNVDCPVDCLKCK